MTHDQIVEEMREAWRSLKPSMENVLSVVKKHIGEIAMVCPECRHEGDIGIRSKCICRGSGVVPKEASDVKA